MLQSNYPKISHLTSHISPLSGRGAFCFGRSISESICGRNRRENAGISSESKVRTLAVENLRIPGEGQSAQGKSGPKERPKGVSDGQQVESPALLKT